MRTFHWPAFYSLSDARALVASVQSLADHLETAARMLVAYNGDPANWNEWLGRVRPLLPSAVELVNVWDYHAELTRSAYGSVVCGQPVGMTKGSAFFKKWLGYCVPGLCPSPSVYLDTDTITFSNPAHVLEAMEGACVRYIPAHDALDGGVYALWLESDCPWPMIRDGAAGTLVFPSSLAPQRLLEAMSEVIVSFGLLLSRDGCAEQGACMAALGRFPSAPLSPVLYRICHPGRPFGFYGIKEITRPPVEMIHFVNHSLFSEGTRIRYCTALLHKTAQWKETQHA